MTTIPQEVFASGLLNKAYHDRLIADLPSLAQTAGIPARFVWAPLSKYCNGAAFDWVANMASSESAGMVYIGKMPTPVEDTMMAITGAFMRNYLDARMMTVQDVLARLKTDSMPEPRVLLIPNFCLDKAEGGDIASWQVANLLGLLYSRMAKDLKTILYCGSIASLEKAYGSAFRDHIEAHYRIVS